MKSVRRGMPPCNSAAKALSIYNDYCISTTMRRPVERAVPAVKRATAILRLLGARAEPLGVNAIARALGLVPSTCLHILRALVADGLVAVDLGRLYRLDAGLAAIARRMLQQGRFSHEVQPGLYAIAAR